MKLTRKTPSMMNVLPNVTAFLIGLGAAWYLNWETTDLVWSLWLSSLVVGYMTILSTIGAGAYVGIKSFRQETFPKGGRIPALLGGTVFGLFMLAFFSFHFCAFHAGHAAFLSSFFPVESVPKNAFFDTFMNPLKLWNVALTHLFPLYGIFLIATIIVERKNLMAPFIKMQGVGGSNPYIKAVKTISAADKEKPKASDNLMTRPYINVVRMHILIFFFAIAHGLKVDSFFVYAVVYAVYFFPWSNIFERS